MKIISMMMALAMLLVTAGAVWAAEGMPEMPQPAAEHAWLQQFVGEWESETEAKMPHEDTTMTMKGTESTRSLGGFWTITEVKSTMMDQPFTGTMTLGYDTNKQKYVGTWVDSMTGHMWQYEGALDESGKVLTLESEGMCPMRPGKTTKFRETIEIKSPDHKVFSSAMMDENGQWTTMMTSHARRVK